MKKYMEVMAFPLGLWMSRAALVALVTLCVSVIDYECGYGDQGMALNLPSMFEWPAVWLLEILDSWGLGDVLVSWIGFVFPGLVKTEFWRMSLETPLFHLFLGGTQHVILGFLLQGWLRRKNFMLPVCIILQVFLLPLLLLYGVQVAYYMTLWRWPKFVELFCLFSAATVPAVASLVPQIRKWRLWAFLYSCVTLLVYLILYCVSGMSVLGMYIGVLKILFIAFAVCACAVYDWARTSVIQRPAASSTL